MGLVETKRWLLLRLLAISCFRSIRAAHLGFGLVAPINFRLLRSDGVQDLELARQLQAMLHERTEVRLQVLVTERRSDCRRVRNASGRTVGVI